MSSTPRMYTWALLSAVLLISAMTMQSLFPGNVFAVSVYKAHLLALGGWGGYWLDRALFPYDRPHTHLEPEGPAEAGPDAPAPTVDYADVAFLNVASPAFGHSMLRRAIIVAACLVCVGLGA